MTLHELADKLGGKVCGNEVRCPGPRHSSNDSSLCIKLDPGAPGGFVVKSFAGDDWRECRDYVKDGIGASEIKVDPNRTTSLPDKERNLARARHLWSCAKPAKDTIVETYLYARGITCEIPATIRYLEPCAYLQPAMIAAFGIGHEWDLSIANDALRGAHLTFLQPDGSGKADIQQAKITLGPSFGWPIIVAPPNDLLAIAITEGIEDGLSVHQALGMGAWVAGSASRMPELAEKIPEHIETITIFMHNDAAGRRGADELAKILSARRFEVFIAGAP